MVVVRPVVDLVEQVEQFTRLAAADVLLESRGDGLLLRGVIPDAAGLIDQLVVKIEVGGHGLMIHIGLCGDNGRSCVRMLRNPRQRIIASMTVRPILAAPADCRPRWIRHRGNRTTRLDRDSADTPQHLSQLRETAL